MAFADHVKSLLLSDISSIAQNSHLFVDHPGRDFTRNRKLFFICSNSSTAISAREFDISQQSFLPDPFQEKAAASGTGRLIQISQG